LTRIFCILIGFITNIVTVQQFEMSIVIVTADIIIVDSRRNVINSIITSIGIGIELRKE